VSCKSVIRPLNPTEAQNTLAADLADVADDIRQIATDFGARPLRAFLVWLKSSGEERGQGEEEVLARVELLPTPVATDLSSMQLNPYSAGVYPLGSVRLTEVSAARYDRDTLKGKPPVDVTRIDPERIGFFYELVDDGRLDNPSRRQRFRLFAEPNLQADRAEWSVLLERTHEDLTRNGKSNLGTDIDRPEFP